MRFRRGKLAIITFYDHSIGAKNHVLPICRVFGKIHANNKKDLIIVVWELVNASDVGEYDHNAERVRIIKSAIIDLKYVS